MYKSIIAVALAGLASAAVQPSGYDNASASSSVAAPTGYASTTSAAPSDCSAYVSTLIYRSTTLYSTIYASGYGDNSSVPTGAPYPVPGNNGTAPAMPTGAPTTTTPGSPAQQTDNAGAAIKPLGALFGVAGFAVALL